MSDFTGGRRGSAVQWFAIAAVALSVASMAGAHALDWLSQSGRVSLVAYRGPVQPAPARVADAPGVDPMPTGSIPATALMIRIR